MVIAAIFTIAKTWKQLQCPSTDEWIRGCGMYIFTYKCIYIHNGILLNYKKGEILLFVIK